MPKIDTMMICLLLMFRNYCLSCCKTLNFLSTLPRLILIKWMASHWEKNKTRKTSFQDLINSLISCCGYFRHGSDFQMLYKLGLTSMMNVWTDSRKRFGLEGKKHAKGVIKIIVLKKMWGYLLKTSYLEADDDIINFQRNLNLKSLAFLIIEKQRMLLYSKTA